VDAPSLKRRSLERRSLERLSLERLSLAAAARRRTLAGPASSETGRLVRGFWRVSLPYRFSTSPGRTELEWNLEAVLEGARLWRAPVPRSASPEVVVRELSGSGE